MIGYHEAVITRGPSLYTHISISIPNCLSLIHQTVTVVQCGGKDNIHRQGHTLICLGCPQGHGYDGRLEMTTINIIAISSWTRFKSK